MKRFVTVVAVAAVLGFALGASPPTATATPFQFGSATNTTVGTAPQSVISGDFDRDGDLDLAVVNGTSGTVSILLNNGSGVYGAPTSVTVGTEPRGITKGDFNRDGKLDLAVVNSGSNTVSILIGNGSGGFSVTSTPATSGVPVAVTSGDFDRDGKPDLAVAASTGNAVDILRGNGDGTFVAKVSYTVANAPKGIVAGDFNRDGDLDLALTTGGDEVRVLLGTSGATFGAATSFSLGAGTAPKGIAVADFDRDGKLDIATADSSSSNVSILRGNGNGTFATHVEYPAGGSPSGLAVLDVERNAAPDLAVTNESAATVSLLAGNGSGGFLAPVTVGVQTTPRAVATGDFNSDGKPDLAVANNGSSSVSVALSTTFVATGFGFYTTPSYPVGSQPAGVAMGDVNRDGWPDAIVADYGLQGASLLLGNGDGSFGTPTTLYTGTASTPWSVVVADFNGDGNEDFALGDYTSDPGGVDVFLGNGDGTFADCVHVDTGSSAAGLATADMNRDGAIDIVAVESYGSNSDSVVVLTNNGAGGFSIGAHYAAGGTPTGVAVADFNRDGKPDVVVTDYTDSQVSVLLGNGDGTLQSGSAYGCGSGPQGVTVADFNRDGKLDVAVADSGGSHVSVLMGNGSGGLGTAVDYILGDWPMTALADDFNRDGTIDIATPDAGTNTMSILSGSGSGTFTLANSWPTGDSTSPAGLGAADLNLDGRTDFVAADQFADQVTVFVTDGIPPVTSDNCPAAWRSLPFTITLTRNDIGSGVASTWYRIDSGSWTSGASVLITAPADHSNDGAHTVQYYSIDNAGNVEDTRSCTARIDTTNPTVTGLTSSTHPVQTNWYANNTPSFTWGGSDATSGVAGYTYVMDQSAGTAAPTTGAAMVTSYTSPSRADGIWYLHVRDVDAAGNWGTTSTYTVKIDTTQPTISSLASATHPVQTTWYANNTPSFTWGGGDATSGVAGYTYVMDQSAGTAAPTTGAAMVTSYTSPSRADGTWYLHVRDVDAAGNWGTTSTYTVKIDTVAPSAMNSLASSTHPNQANWYSSSTPAFTWSASTDATSGIAGYSYVFDQVSNTTPDNTVDTVGLSYTSPSRADGTWYLHICAVDAAGNVGAVTHYTVKIDTVLPSAMNSLASSTHPNQANWYSSNTPAFTWSAATDAAPSSGIAGYSYVFDQVSNTNPDNTIETAGTSYTSSSRADGTWYLHVRAVDAAGNMGPVSHFTVKIDIAAPSAMNSLASSTHPNQANWYSSSTPAFTWSASTDATSGIAGYSYVFDQVSNTTPDNTVDTVGLSYTSPSRADGTWYLHICAVDAAGNVGAVTHYTVKIDTVLPSAMNSLASSTHPNQANWYSSNTPAFTWSAATDAAPSSGIAGYSYVFDQVSNTNPDNTIETAGTSYTSSSRADGTWYLHVRAVDAAGNMGPVSHFTVKIDTTQPTISSLASATHPVQTTWYANNTPSFTWGGSDATSGVAGYTYVMDQSAGTAAPTTGAAMVTSYTSPSRADGIWYLHVRDVDNAGNWGTTSTYTVNIDTGSPAISLLTASPHVSQALWYSNNTPTFSWAGGDTWAGVAGYSYAIDHVTNTTPDAVSEGTGTTYTPSALADGTWYFHVRAVDAASPGNWSLASHYTVNVDTVAPSAMNSLASSTHPVQANWYANSTPAFTWSASTDATSGIAGYSYVFDQVSNTTPDNTVETTGLSYTSPSRADGTWYLHIRAVDNAGNMGAVSHYTVKIDTVAPSAMNSLASSTHPVQANWYANNTPAFTWSASTDATSGIAGYSYVFDQVSNTTPDNTVETAGTSYTSPSRADGTWYLHVCAVDAAGNVGAVSHYTVKIDATQPTISSLSSASHPSQSTWYADTTPDFAWAGSDATSGVTGYSYDVDQTSNTTPDTTSEGTGTTFTTSALSPDGIYYFHIRACDAAGNWGPAVQYSVRIDTTGATIATLTSASHPVQTNWYNDATADLSWTGSDARSGVNGYSYVVDQSSGTTPDTVSEGVGTTYTTGTLTPDGIYYFHVRAVDVVGNWGSASQYTLRVDTAAPSAISGLASSTHPSQSTWYANNTPAFTWSAATDATSGVAGYSYVLDQSPGTVPDATIETVFTNNTFASKADGTWYFHVRAVDAAGNAGATSHYTVNIDVTGATISSLTSSSHPSQSTWYTDTTADLSWSGSDNFTGVNGYSYVVDQNAGTTPDTTSEGTGTTYTTSALSPDGTWYFHVRARDGAGNWGAASHYAIKVDTTTPTIATLTSSTHPVQTNWYGNNTPSFDWTGSDASAGVNGYSYVLDQSPSTTPDAVSEGAGTSYTSPVLTPDGTYYFHVRARDSAGNWGAASHYTVNIDTSGPTILLVSSASHPSQALWYPDNTPDFNWTGYSDLADITGYSYVIDANPTSTPDTISEGTATSYTSGVLADGTWYFHVRALDSAGNWGAASDYAFNIDTTSPSAMNSLASATHPVQANWYTNTTPAFTWSAATDAAPGSGIAGYSYVFDQVANTTPDSTVETTGLSYTSPSRADGIWYLHVRAVDNAGNMGPVSHYTVKIDTGVPSAASGVTASPHANPVKWYSDSTPDFSWSAATDATSPVAGYSYVLDQSAGTIPDNVTETGGLTYTPAARADGTWYFHVRAVDSAGNAGATTHFQVNIDVTIPSVMSGLASSTHPNQTNWFANNTPAFTWSASTDAASGIAGYSYVFDQSALTNPDNTVDTVGLSYTSPSRADGTWYLHIRAVDGAGNMGTVTHYTVKIDVTNPSAMSGLTSPTHPSQASWYSNSSPTFNWSAATDSASGVAGYSYVLDQATGTVPDNVTETSSTSYAPGALANGTWYLHIRAVDRAGNVGTVSQFQVNIDTVLPSAMNSLASATHPVQTTWYANNTPAFTWSAATDAAPSSGIAGYSYVFDQVSNTTPDNTVETAGTSYTSPSRADGTWYLHIRAVDGAGNMGPVSHYTAKIDTTQPTISSLASASHPVQTTWYANNTPSFTWAGSDATSGVAGYTYVMDQSAGTAAPTTGAAMVTSYTSPSRADGIWYLHVRDVDAAGNWGATSTYTVNIDVVAPATGDDAPTGWRHGPLTVTLSPDDGNGSGVASTTYRVDGGAWVGGTSVPFAIWKRGGGNGVHTIEYYSTDVVGNVASTASVTVSLDSQPPVTTNNAPAGSSSVDVTVHLAPNDANSGVAATYYRLDAGSWQTVSGSSGADVLVTAAGNNGIHWIQYYSADTVGNTETLRACKVVIAGAPGMPRKSGILLPWYRVK